jgi:hypothetical protein
MYRASADIRAAGTADRFDAVEHILCRPRTGVVNALVDALLHQAGEEAFPNGHGPNSFRGAIAHRGCGRLMPKVET